MSVLDLVIGWIAPPCCVICGTEGETLCLVCVSRRIIPYGERCFGCGAASPDARTCERCRPAAPQHVWVGTNYEAAAQELIKKYKFGHQRAAAESIANLMIQTILSFNDIQQIKEIDYSVVPVPTASSRIRQRSFDHSAYLARHIAQRLNLDYMNVLTRVGQTRQVGAERSARLSQPDGNYMIRYPNLVEGQSILLIDDVVTTGATLRAAAKTLRAYGAARVDALVFAKRL